MGKKLSNIKKNRKFVIEIKDRDTGYVFHRKTIEVTVSEAETIKTPFVVFTIDEQNKALSEFVEVTAYLEPSK